MAGRNPPRFVPTLTEVVQPTPAPEAGAPAAPPIVQEELVQRVLQRVEATLDGRLRETLAAVVIEQTRALGPILQAQIEALVRQAVAEAFEQELRGTPRA